MTPETAEWLDGPRLVAWLRENGLTNVTVQLGPSLERRIRHWRDGSAAHVYNADEVLCKLDLALSAVPEDFWVAPPRDFQAIPDDKKLEIVRRVSDLGEPIARVARAVEVDHKTVRRYAGLEKAA